MITYRYTSSLGFSGPRTNIGRALRIGCAVALIGMGVFQNPPFFAQTERRKEIPEEPERTNYTAFDPSHQKHVSTESRNLIISLQRTENCPTCPAGKVFLFQVEHKEKGTTTRFRISNETAQIDQAYIVSTERAVVVGRIQASTSILNLVDLNTGQLLDEVRCFDPSISPSHRFMAYAKVFPLHFVPGVSYEYLVYDLTATPQENRTPPNKGKLSDRYDVGWPVYPEGVSNTSSDNILSDQSLTHFISSDGFFWLDTEHNFAFTDHWQNVQSLVLVNLSRGLARPSVTVKPLVGLGVVDIKKCEEGAFQVSRIEVARGKPGNIHLTFRSSTPSCISRPGIDIGFGEALELWAPKQPPTLVPRAEIRPISTISTPVMHAVCQRYQAP